MNSFYKNIRRMREWHNLTQQNMADELSITQKHYSRIEQGQVDISISMAEKIAGIFDMK
jgi:DNA-binding XRE family transcriptional regulator